MALVLYKIRYLMLMSFPIEVLPEAADKLVVLSKTVDISEAIFLTKDSIVLLEATSRRSTLSRSLNLKTF